MRQAGHKREEHEQVGDQDVSKDDSGSGKLAVPCNFLLARKSRVPCMSVIGSQPIQRDNSFGKGPGLSVAHRIPSRGRRQEAGQAKAMQNLHATLPWKTGVSQSRTRKGANRGEADCSFLDNVR